MTNQLSNGGGRTGIEAGRHLQTREFDLIRLNLVQDFWRQNKMSKALI
jgi:hypothetical protein